MTIALQYEKEFNIFIELLKRLVEKFLVNNKITRNKTVFHFVYKTEKLDVIF